MASRRATNHFSYDRYFRPLLAEMQRRERESLPPEMVATMTKSKGVETRARFYTWRKLFGQWLEKNFTTATDADIALHNYALTIVTKGEELPDGQWKIVFRIDRGEDFLQMFGVGASTTDTACGEAGEAASLAPTPRGQGFANAFDNAFVQLRSSEPLSEPLAQPHAQSVQPAQYVESLRRATPQPPEDAWAGATTRERGGDGR
jgi:hypothetical protein